MSLRTATLTAAICALVALLMNLVNGVFSVLELVAHSVAAGSLVRVIMGMISGLVFEAGIAVYMLVLYGRQSEG